MICMAIFLYFCSPIGADMDLTVSKLGCKHAGQSTLTRKTVVQKL